MTTRTTETTVIFAQPFTLRGFPDAFPAGSYVVETDEELLDGVSVVAYRRTLTLLHLHQSAGRSGLGGTMAVDPDDLQAALDRDRANSVSADHG